MRTMLLAFTLALSLFACVTDDTAAKRDDGVVIVPVHFQDPNAPARHAELDGVATPESEFYCEQDADCGPGLTCIIQRHSCFDERGRLDEDDVPVATIGE